MEHSNRVRRDGQRTPRYIKRLIELYGAGLFDDGACYLIEVAHDRWCPKLAGGPCCCAPAIRAKRVKDA